jgi:multiple sugar transport system permease protein
MKSRSYQRGFRMALPFLLPSLTGMLLFSVIPIIVAVFLGFTEWNGLSKISLTTGFFQTVSEFWVGLKNYGQILWDKEFWHVLGNTGYYILLYVPSILIASTVVAMILNSGRKMIGLYRVLYYIPVLTSWVAGALIWKWVLSPDLGAMNNILALIGIQGPAWLQDKTWAMPGIVLASIWKDAGFFGLILLGGLQAIDPTYSEAASIDGAGRFQKLFRITIPLLTPVLFFILVITLINSFQLFPQVMIMTTDAGPNGATQSMVERIYKYAFKYFKMGYASSFAWLLFVIIFFFTSIQMKMQNKWVNYDA